MFPPQEIPWRLSHCPQCGSPIQCQGDAASAGVFFSFGARTHTQMPMCLDVSLIPGNGIINWKKNVLGVNQNG